VEKSWILVSLRIPHNLWLGSEDRVWLSCSVHLPLPIKGYLFVPFPSILSLLFSLCLSLSLSGTKYVIGCGCRFFLLLHCHLHQESRHHSFFNSSRKTIHTIEMPGIISTNKINFPLISVLNKPINKKAFTLFLPPENHLPRPLTSRSQKGCLGFLHI
jgi:hypothetical protein